MKRSFSLRTAALILAGLVVVLGGIGAYIVSSSWSSFADSQTELSSAKSDEASAQVSLSFANVSLSSANAAYEDWRSCYYTTSYFWDWICGNQYSLYADVLDAEAAVTAAEDELTRAETAVRAAEQNGDAAAERFNTDVVVWSVVEGLVVVAALVVGVLALRKRRKDRQAQAIVDRPDWACPSCGTHNEGGMFCVGCGFSKSDATAMEVLPPEQVTSDPADGESAPAEDVK